MIKRLEPCPRILSTGLGAIAQNRGVVDVELIADDSSEAVLDCLNRDRIGSTGSLLTVHRPSGPSGLFMPNTKVKLKHALISGILAGTAHQAFQFLYISSQLWVSRYNAIYGSFAALPMFLLWLQVSWTICLFGAELTYAGQNIRNFSFDKDARNISRRYRDFISILIMSLIAKRFEQDVQPYTAEEISEECQIPIRLTHETLYELQEINLLHEVVTDEKSEDIAYQPSMDINKMNVALLLDKLDTHGSEDFKIDKENEFNNQWGALLKAREEYYKNASKVLLKDL